jgi:hypothetical protein
MVIECVSECVEDQEINATTSGRSIRTINYKHDTVLLLGIRKQHVAAIVKSYVYRIAFSISFFRP